MSPARAHPVGLALSGLGARSYREKTGVLYNADDMNDVVQACAAVKQVSGYPKQEGHGKAMLGSPWSRKSARLSRIL
ncbi:hypothetical protein VKT23_014118 [Stygiomarasmius scandens]|uniref:Uncharacterized protein n=1 Tax=Marasmiellus scandens TaxID=2682957 RepID=A0ABR1J3T4_9AGAR